MKRLDLVRHLEAHGCYLVRDRGKHSVYVNPANSQTSAVPRSCSRSRPARDRSPRSPFGLVSPG
jgi:predicted RNA binding protein YcfA (HicA-like mRNA interferase family)